MLWRLIRGGVEPGGLAENSRRHRSLSRDWKRPLQGPGRDDAQPLRAPQKGRSAEEEKEEIEEDKKEEDGEKKDDEKKKKTDKKEKLLVMCFFQHFPLM